MWAEVRQATARIRYPCRFDTTSACFFSGKTLLQLYHKMNPAGSASIDSTSANSSADTDQQPFTYINPKYRSYFDIDPGESPELRDSPPTRAIPTESTNGNQDAISECFDDTVCYEGEVGDGRVYWQSGDATVYFRGPADFRFAGTTAQNKHRFEIDSGEYDLVMASLDGAAVSAPLPARPATTGAVPFRSTAAEGVASATEPEGGDKSQMPSIGSSTFWLQAKDNAAVAAPLGPSIMAQLFTSADGRTQLGFYCSSVVLTVDGRDAKSQRSD